MNSVWNLEKIYGRGITGEGIATAVFDTGVYPHRAFLESGSRIRCFRDFVNEREDPYDDNGHGTHVSGIITGHDSLLMKSRHYPDKKTGYMAGHHPNLFSYGGRCPGVAPDSSIIALKVLDEKGNGKMTTMIRSLDWLISNYRKYGVRIVNISVGMPLNKTPDEKQELLIKKVEKLWDLGLVVVVAAGNEGPKPCTVTVPGISRKVITVGALEENRGGRNQRKKLYSGRGPVPMTCVCKPDVIAPAAGILSCNNNYDGYVRRSGTSMAAPLVSGLLALLLSQKPRLSNLDIKRKLMETSIDTGQPKNQQGWGLINPGKLML